MSDANEELDSVAEESDEDSDEETEEQSSQHVHDYDDSERDHDIALAIYQHVSCFTHTLQLVVHTYDKDVSSSFKTALSKANKLVKKFAKSTKATEKFIQQCGKKLISACPTRWSSIFLMISRLLEVKSSVIFECNELGWNP